MSNEGTIQFLQKYIKSVTQMRLNQYCKPSTFTNVEFDPTKGQTSFGEEISLILLWGACGHITLKTFFDLKTATSLASQTLQKPESQITTRVANEFCAEISNLQAAYIRGILEDNDLFFGMSLPFRASGDGEALFKKLRGNKTAYCAWKSTNNAQELFFTAEIVLSDPASIEGIRSKLEADYEKQNAPAATSSGDIEFF